MNASLNEKLRNVKWGEYKLGDLFEIEHTLSFNADKLVNGTEYDYVTRTSTNQGILQTTGFVNKDNVNAAGTWSLGLLSMDFFYRRKPWYAGQFVRKVIPKISISEKAVSFFSTILNKQKPILLSVLVRGVDETFKNISVKLPQTADNKLDFDFMESFIAELEAERVAELSAYLTVSGLDNYELSSDEENALKNYQSLKWGEYKLGDLFEITTAKSIDKNKIQLSNNAEYEFVGRSSKDNGVQGYVEKLNYEPNRCDTFSVAQVGETVCLYREREWYASQNIFVLSPRILEIVKQHAFITASINKALYPYSNAYIYPTLSELKEIRIQLPQRNGKIDFDFMATLISTIQKLVIRDVVLYADRKIEKTREIIKR